MKISKHITKNKKPFNNADGTYYIEVKYDYCFKKSLICVYVEVTNLLDNKKGKFYYKIEPLISASHLNNKKKDTNR